jgi:hypothetical protein
MLTVDDISKALPPSLRSAATQQLADQVNNIIADPLVAESVRENFVSYASILKDGKFKMEDYLHAVVYVGFKLMGMSNKRAYELTFPARMNNLIGRGATGKDISAYVSAYAKGKLVNLLLEQSMIPTWVLNQDAYQKAINKQVSLMATANSELVQTQAANSLLTHLKKPEVKEFQISMETKENSGMRQLMDTMASLAQRQLDLIANGVSTKDIAALPLVEAEYTDVASN